eukprot:scaffold10364_cov61-Attheya_sp.AAC.1
MRRDSLCHQSVRQFFNWCGQALLIAVRARSELKLIIEPDPSEAIEEGERDLFRDIQKNDVTACRAI